MHVVGTAGHVDHGKSTLVEALTGIDPDRFEEEKRRGLTIDLGFAWCTLPSGRDMAIVDVPGHERFIRNMLAGVGGVAAALFVVAADEGWMPQSAEHLQILDFLGIGNGIVAITKRDLVDDEMLEFVMDDVRKHLEGTALEDAPLMPLSATTGHGIEELREGLDALLGGIAGSADRGRPRLFVDRAFTIVGAGTVVTGTLTGGRLRTGEEVTILPKGTTARVRSLQTHKRTVEEAVPGSRVAVNLVGVEKEDVGRGDALVRGAWVVSDRFCARLRTTGDLRHPLAERGAYELYVGSAELPCRLKFLEDPPPRAGRIPAISPGGSLLVQIHCMASVALEPGDRFIVRDVGRWETVAGGTVLDHVPGRVRRNDPELLRRLTEREAASGPDIVGRIVSERKLVGRDELAVLAGVAPAELGHAVDALTAEGSAIATDGFVVDAASARGLEERAIGALERHHAEHELAPGMPRDELRRALDLPQRAFAELASTWTRIGSVVADGAIVKLPGHGPALGPQDRAAADRAVEMLRSAGASPPDATTLELRPELLRALERSGEIVLVGPQIAYASSVLADIERSVVSMIERDGPVTVAQVRDAVGTSRKYAVPLLEHLDGRGITQRRGDTRVLGPRGRELAALQPRSD